MSKIPQISDSEWQIMKVIWAHAPCTANRVVEVLSETSDWQPKTIKTLINRLVNKEAIGYKVYEKDKKTYHYYPLVSENECVKAESQSFLKRVFGGSPNIMLANFIKECELSQEDIDELKLILDKKKG
ncbi:MAG: BlaI/MecI/CopY family transcriptional regulator [Ruminiclostridium sp.]|nr:BlaI/MecI/CopY family transcriptional regulator [Ruminiclostridium sp.]